MRYAALAATSLLAVFSIASSVTPSKSADLLWKVESPFRFFKRSASFDMYERAFDAVRGDPSSPLPEKIIWKTERRLNDPDCRDSSTPNACAGTARKNFEASRQGWAAQTVDFTCYERNARPRHYATTCARQYSWGTAKEDYVLPDAHTVHVWISPEVLAALPAGDCTWTWTPHRAGLAGETRKQPCKDQFVIKRVPYSLDHAASGAAVKVTLPDGRELADPGVTVQDLFVVAMGDSFMSGEGNPDKPIRFSASREMVYDPTNSDTRDVASYRSIEPRYGVASAPSEIDAKRLPKRLMDDEERSLIFRPNTAEFEQAFNKADAQWLSVDCHRSQYGYPFRVSLELALENRHRAVTLVSLACSGSDIVNGVFNPLDAREKFSEPNGSKTVVSQLDQLSDLICRNGAAGRTTSASYTLPVYKSGSTGISSETITKRWCPTANRKRPIDLVLLSIGGNDVGFSALAMYAMTNSADDLAPIAGWVGSQIRYSPRVSEVYMGVLDQRFKAVKAAFVDGFGIDPSRVVQNAYEQIQFDETGAPCGAQPTIGLDVHPKYSYARDRVTEVSNFARTLQVRLECISDARKPGCPSGLATGTGTGFRFVTDHLAEFAKRGLCARDPAHAFADQVAMGMPRLSRATQEWEPYSPAYALPYAHHWRLVRDPNDSFLIANTHREGISLFDLLQPAFASLYSGAFHPTAEGHAIVADHVIKHARDVVDAKGGPQRQAAARN